MDANDSDFDHPTPRDRHVICHTLTRAADRFQSMAFQTLHNKRSDGLPSDQASNLYQDVALALRAWADKVVGVTRCVAT